MCKLKAGEKIVKSLRNKKSKTPLPAYTKEGKANIKKRSPEERKAYKAKKEEARQKAIKGAEVSMKDGVKITKYPPVEDIKKSATVRSKNYVRPFGRPVSIQNKKEGGMLKTPDNPGLKKLPTEVRNKMGYMKEGGKVKKGYHKMPDGRIMKDSAHKGMKKGGSVKCKRDGICVRGKTKGRMV